MKTLRIAITLFAAALLLVLALAGTLWFWSGTSSSLATALTQVARYLPAGQVLELREVDGTLRDGGRIGWLRWQHGALSVEAREVRLHWALQPLLAGELRLGQLAIQQLRIDDQRPPAAAMTPPLELRLPFKVDIPFAVTTLQWAGPPALQLDGLRGHYSFDGQAHVLDAVQVQVASGHYQLNGRLQAQAPMALSLQLQGSVQTTLPASRQPLPLQAHAELHGALAGPAATLELQARLQPEPATAAPERMQAQVSARLQPWQAQAVVSADARWQALDLAALWPQAPQTRLSGVATVTPARQGWRAGVELSNTQSGPWDRQRLPLDSLSAELAFAAGQWTVESLQARGAGGRLEAAGQVSAAAHWQGRASAHGLNLAALDSRLATTALDGQLTAEQTPAGLAFAVQLQAAAALRAGAAPGLRLDLLQAQGLWQGPRLKLDTLAVHADDARLSGQLTFDRRSQAADGQLALSLPGAQGTLAGHLASHQGQGELQLRVNDATRATRWLARWPGLSATLGHAPVQGDAELTGHWQGGWQQQGQALQIQANLRARQLAWHDAARPAAAWRLRDLHAELAGTLRALDVTLQGQAEQATRRFALQTRLQAGRVSDGVWRARLETAELTAQDSLQPGTWALQLDEGVSFRWKQQALLQALDIAAGSARLSGPAAGAASVQWQAAQWSRQGAHHAWRSQGQLQGLPLAWLDLLNPTPMAELGLRGDLRFGGQWDASGGEQLRLRATLERSGGDLQVPADAAPQGSMPAGVREARLVLTADGPELAASLRWASERAGEVQADVSTRLRHQQDGWNWPADAPLAGTLRAQLPSLGVWSLLAPPGWRLRGTLDAQAVLSGSRSTPQWRGTLQAQDLAVRSVADGIDFSQGRLRATLDGTRLDIVELSLLGAGGASGGVLSITGSATWQPPSSGSATTIASRLQLALQAQARGLRVSARADRRMALSGQLNAQLDETRLAIRGELTVDQARFLLPEDTAPRLGDDVLVRAPGDGPPQRAPQSTAPAWRLRPELAITLDLGPDFEVRGRGLATHLAGQLFLRNAPETGRLLPHLSGELRTVRGSYRAYGQPLDIEEGVLRFAGAYDNPTLAILALRPNLPQRVGVQISGTVLAPTVRLYAEPELPEAEKLAWLVLGRAASRGGTETAVLQQAALALLGGSGQRLSAGLAEALGLDELSLSGATGTADGSSTAGTTVTLGKRVSRDFYVAYERSLAGVLGTFSIFYDLSRRFTLRAQTGERSAVDLIYTLRYD